MQPYTYYIYHRPTNKHYYGVQYGKMSCPDNLWKTYFTSSKKIKSLIRQYGKDSFHVEIRKLFDSPKKAKLWENKVLRKMKVLHREDWLNDNIGGHWITRGGAKKGNIPWNKGIPMTDEQKQTLIESRKRKGLNMGDFLPVLSGDRNPMRNPEILAKYKQAITGRKRKYREDGSWYWYKD